MRNRAIISLTLAVLMSSVAAFAQNAGNSPEEQCPRLLSHRGGRGEFDQNTMHAFKSSIEAGCNGIETDIRMTSDGKLFLFHDGNMKKITGVDSSIEKMTAAELRKVRTLKGNSIPSLKEFMDYINGQDGLYVQFELKCGDYSDGILQDYCEKVWEAVMSAKPEKSIYIITSFHVKPLVYLKSKHPEADMMLLVSKPCTKEVIEQCKSLGLKRLSAKLENTSRSDVKAAHDAGLKLNLFPQPKVTDTLLAFALGADYLCTDVPVEAIKFIKEHDIPIRL